MIHPRNLGECNDEMLWALQNIFGIQTGFVGTMASNAIKVIAMGFGLDLALYRSPYPEAGPRPGPRPHARALALSLTSPLSLALMLALALMLTLNVIERPQGDGLEAGGR